MTEYGCPVCMRFYHKRLWRVTLHKVFAHGWLRRLMPWRGK